MADPAKIINMTRGADGALVAEVFQGVSAAHEAAERRRELENTAKAAADAAKIAQREAEQAALKCKAIANELRATQAVIPPGVVTYAQLRPIVEQICDSVVEADHAMIESGDKCFAIIRAELNELHARVAAAEQRGILFRGVWQRAEQNYKTGDVVTHKAGLWIALHPTTDEPGKSNSWQLGCKL